MDTRRLTEIEERCEKATPGPWQNKHFDSAIGDTGDYDHCDRITASDGSPSPVYVHDEWGGRANSCEDSAFIAASRTDLPDLLAYCKSLRAEAAELAQALENFQITDCVWNAVVVVPRLKDSDTLYSWEVGAYRKVRELLSRPTVVELMKEKD